VRRSVCLTGILHTNARKRQVIVSRLSDVVIACALLVLTLPLMVIVAVAIRCESPGPIFEPTPCVVHRGRFQMLQFRSSAHTPEARRSWGEQRLTRVGAFLRYTRIESLPQLLNVLMGDLTLIGAEGDLPTFL